MSSNGILNSFLIFLYSTLTQASAIGEVNTNSPWQFELGSRYWLSTNNYTKTLYGNPSAPPLSKLSYKNATGNSAEGWWQLTHFTGLFLKGFFGGGSISKGSMYDEDFPPGVNLYSKTYQEQRNGTLNYLSADLGYYFLSAPKWQLGVLLGYHYWAEDLNTFGCIQMAGNQEFCATVPPVLGPVPNSADTLDNKAHWSSLRIGATGAAQLSPRIRFSQLPKCYSRPA
jgi:hypothetical protein